MSKEDVIKVQTCVLKVNIHCDGCEKKVKKILHKIDGVYQSSIDAEEGMVTVLGLVDPDTIVKKLNRAGRPAALWGAKPGVVSQPQKLQLGGGNKDQPQDAGGKMPFPAAAPADDPKSVNFNDDEGSELDDEFDDDGFDDEDFEDDGLDADLCEEDPRMMMKNDGAGGRGGGGTEILVQIKGNPNSGAGGKQNPGQGGGAAAGRPMVSDAGGPMAGMPPQRGMMGGAGFPGMGQMGGGPSGMPITMGHHPHMSGGMLSGPEMLQAAAAAGNPMAQQQYMGIQQQQQMMMGGHGHHGHHGHGGHGYPPMCYGCGRPPMPYPMPPPSNAEAPYNIFSDENANNSCSVM